MRRFGPCGSETLHISIRDDARRRSRYPRSVYEAEAVRGLVGRYCDAVARFDVEAFASTWAPDATWFLPTGQEIRGREGIVELYRETRSRYALCIQEILSSLVDPAGRARWYVREFQWREGAEGSQLIGVYDDSLSGAATAPRFASRRFTLLYRGPADLSGRLHGPSRLEAFDLPS